MASISPMTHIDSMSGKYAKSDQVYTKVRKFDERTFGIRMKHPATNEPPSAAQQTVQDKMKTVMAQVKTVLNDPQQKATYKEKWLKQRKCKTLRGYVFRELYNADNGGNGNG